MDKLLVIKHIQVEGANAIAGLTWGFPAITNFLGFTHALQRKVHQHISQCIMLDSCAVICHSSQVQSYNNNMSRESYFALTRNPLVLKGKEAVTAPFNEEGKMRIDVSLLISVRGKDDGFIDPDDLDDFMEWVPQYIPQLRLAGGMIQALGACELLTGIAAMNSDRQQRKHFLRQFLPGFALVSAHDILQRHIEQTQQPPLDAWLDFSALKKRAVQPENDGDKTHWQIERPDFSGWLKPIMVGYQGISDLYAPGTVGHVRDREVPVQFVESVYSLGQWISPHRINDIAHLFWTQTYDAQSGLYLCNNFYQPETPVLLNNEQSEVIEEN